MALSHTHSHRQRRQRGLALAAWSLVTLGLVVGAYFVLSDTVPDWTDGVGSMVDGKEKARTLQRQLQDLQGQLEIERTRHEVDRQALEMVRREMAQQKEHTADLEEDLRFYRSLMAPEGVKEGVRLRAPELVARPNPAQVAFRFLVQQEARKHNLVKGELTVEILGHSGGEEVRYTLSELSEEIADTPVPLQFRYFQSLEGELNLPGDFAPESIALLAKVSKPYKVEVQEIFAWQLQERFTHVGK